MIQVPLKPLPAQTVTIQLNEQVCKLHVYQKFYGLFIDVLVDDALIIGGVVCEDRNRIVRSQYLGFDGDFAFIDTLGSDDPDYTGLSNQFRLFYFTDAEVAGLLA